MYQLTKDQKIANLQEQIQNTQNKIVNLQKLLQNLQTKLTKLQNSPSNN